MTLDRGLADADLRARLSGADGLDAAGSEELIAEWRRSGVRFTSSSPVMEAQYQRAIRELFTCIRPAVDDVPILHEGGFYRGSWLESTGSISAEVLSRFLPSVADRTFDAFVRHQRADGLLPYKITDAGPAFAQIQMVSPLARSIWIHLRLNCPEAGRLERFYAAMCRHDAWIAKWRDVRGTGGVEAFCAFDTGHDLSPRFWHIPDSPLNNDPARYNSNNPLLPYIAPDLTANVACQRRYLARLAEELGDSGAEWRVKADASEAALFDCCYDSGDAFFYDLDRNGEHVRVQSDILLRVLACEIGDDAFFEAALGRYLLNTSKFFAKFPFPSIALDEPRFSPAFDFNSWAGPTNFLSLIRAPHAFELHGRFVEFTWVINPTLSALWNAPAFAQTLDPFTGRSGFTESYSPTLLCLLDFVERHFGILPRSDGTLWFTGLAPQQMEQRDQSHETAYRRVVDNQTFDLVNTRDGIAAWRNGEPLFHAPRGVRLVTDRKGVIRAAIGMSFMAVEGAIWTPSGSIPFRAAANEQLELRGHQFVTMRDPGVVAPRYR
jgi:hypothetical protein